MTNKMIGTANRAELQRLCIEFEKAQLELNDAKGEVESLYGQIRAIVDRYDLPTSEGPSQYLDMLTVDLQLRVTRPERSPKLDAEKFLRRVGPEVFLEICTVKAADLDPKLFQLALEEETVTRDDLLDSLIEPGPQKPTIVVSQHKTARS